MTVTSDLASNATEESSPKRGSKQILKSEISEGLDALQKSASGLFMSGLSAGLDLGFSVLLMAMTWSLLHEHVTEPALRFVIGNMYAVGFIFVILGRSELFTEQTTLAVLPLLRGKTTLSALLRLWLIVYVANLIGGAMFARGVTWAVSSVRGLELNTFVEIARHVVERTSTDIFISAVFAGWLMGLLSWLVAAGRDTISQIVLVWLITFAIGFLGLHHVVAGSIEAFAGFFADHSIGGANVMRCILFSTLGNVVGGTVFVAIIKYSHAKPEDGDEAEEDSESSDEKE